MIPSAAIPMIAIQSSLKTVHGHARAAKVRIASLNIIPIHSVIATGTRRKASGPTERAAFFIIDGIPGDPFLIASGPAVRVRAAPFSLSTALRAALAGMTEPRSDFAVV